MKKLKCLKLNQLSNANLLEREMNGLRGGECTCGCGCLYANSGGSSTSSNTSANISGGYFSDVNYYIYCDGETVYDSDGIEYNGSNAGLGGY
jgi:natural product precursor